MNPFAEGEAKKMLLSPAWQTAGVGKGNVKSMSRCIAKTVPGKPSPTGHASMQGTNSHQHQDPLGMGLPFPSPGTNTTSMSSKKKAIVCELESLSA